MADTALEAILRRDRTIVALSIAMLTAIAWLYILWLARGMDVSGMDASGMAMPEMAMPGMAMDHSAMEDMPGMNMGAGETGMALTPALRPWSPTDFAVMLSMWIVMMVGMMTPSAAPMVLLYARVGRQSALQGKPLAATGYFFAGYVLAWVGFALLATLGQWALEKALLLTPMMSSASGLFSGVLLVVIGLYQWTPLKDACLRQCQAPLQFIQRHGGFRREPRGSLMLGLRHGVYCVGCCWALMALLFVGGVMNVFWIALIAIYVLAEKIVPIGRTLSRLAGAALGLTGLWILATTIAGSLSETLLLRLS
jgi:predicted metal-binding membrane protein